MEKTTHRVVLKSNNTGRILKVLFEATSESEARGWLSGFGPSDSPKTRHTIEAKELAA